jgi:hydroxyacylglutathione hydrolase
VGYERRFNASIDAASRGEATFVNFILEGQPEPPLYFARMKRDNKGGAPVLGALPQPRRLTTKELGALAGRTDVAVLDTRLDRSAFMAGHLPGSLYAPLDKTFNTIAGSYVGEDQPIYVIVEADGIEEAVRDLVRIGLDTVVGYATPQTLLHYREEGGTLASIPEIDVLDMETLRKEEGVGVLDVRRLTEYQGVHVEGAYNIAHTRLLARKGELEKGKVWLVHCRTGARSAPASALLARFGYDVRYVNGEFSRWMAAHGAAIEESLA